MFQRSSLILFVSFIPLVLSLSCLGKKVSCNVPEGSDIELLSIKDLTGDPYIYNYVSIDLFKKLSIKSETQGPYLLEIVLKNIKITPIAHDIRGYQAYNRINLKASFNLYERGRIEPFISRTLSLTESYQVDPDPNIALSKRKAAINRLALRLIEEIERSVRVYFCSHPQRTD